MLQLLRFAPFLLNNSWFQLPLFSLFTYMKCPVFSLILNQLCCSANHNSSSLNISVGKLVKIIFDANSNTISTQNPESRLMLCINSLTLYILYFK